MYLFKLKERVIYIRASSALIIALCLLFIKIQLGLFLFVINIENIRFVFHIYVGS